MRNLLPVTLTFAIASPAIAADVKVSVEIPRLNVAEYHRPYVALWLEKPDQSFVGNIAVWYDIKLKDKEGTKWLKDMRQWWRRIGRELNMPMLHLPQLVGLALGLSPKEIGLQRHVVKPTSVIDWTEAVVAGVGSGASGGW